MSHTYAIGDLHGRYDLFGEALRVVCEDICWRGGRRAKVVVLGDVVDRGPDSASIVRFLMDDDNPILDMDVGMIKGNHEDMMVQCCRGKKKLDWWLGNGGWQTIASYGGRGRDTSVIPDEHLDFLDRMPLFHADKHRVYVHAAIDPMMPLDGQSKQTLLWAMYGRDEPGGWRDKFVVHGHESFEDGPIRTNSRINLDTKAYETGRLVMAVFDDEVPGGPINLIEVKGRRYNMLYGDYEE